MANVLALDCTSGAGDVELDLGSSPVDVWVDFDIAFNAAFITAALALTSGTTISLAGTGLQMGIQQSGGTLKWKIGAASSVTPPAPLTDLQAYHVRQHLVAGSPGTYQMWIDGSPMGTDNVTSVGDFEFYDLFESLTAAGAVVYYDNFKMGTAAGASDLASDDFEGGSLTVWNSFVNDAAIISDPGIAPSGGSPDITDGRVGIAFDAGPLDADPVWTFIDMLYDNLVAAIDTDSGKQTNRDTTDTGTATVHLNDTQGLFDPNNVSSPYFGKLDGKQILIQIYNPVDATWYPRWRGTIDDYGYTINPATNPDGTLVVSNIQIDCVDVFDYLAGYELTPGLDGDMPPAGHEGIVFYEDRVDTIGGSTGQIIQILADTNVDPDRTVVFTGNIQASEMIYEPGSSALSALRDLADAEAPTIANIYCDRFGRFVFHGFYSRTNPAGVAATTTPDVWDFQAWKLGDGLAILDDPDRAQIRVLGYSRARSDIINAAVAWPKGMAQKDMPSQVFVDAASIAAYGKHSLSPMSDLIVKEGTTSGYDRKTQCAKYAELIVKNQKDPTERITAIMLKSLPPDDPRAAKTWQVICRGDISDIANVSVGYPGGTGIQDKDNYIEGVSTRIRPLQPIQNGGWDYIEVEFDLTPAEWTMDTHGVFPAFS